VVRERVEWEAEFLPGKEGGWGGEGREGEGRKGEGRREGERERSVILLAGTELWIWYRDCLLRRLVRYPESMITC